jgi:hypothetical protein
VILAVVLFAAGVLPGAIDLLGMVNPDSSLATALVAEKLDTLTVVKAAFLFAALALPITAIRGVIEAHHLLTTPDGGS